MKYLRQQNISNIERESSIQDLETGVGNTNLITKCYQTKKLVTK